MVAVATAWGIEGSGSTSFQVITIPWELPAGLPFWVWGIIVLVVLFILMIIAVRIGR